jgi:hypothetical protein
VLDDSAAAAASKEVQSIRKADYADKKIVEVSPQFHQCSRTRRLIEIDGQLD